MSDLAYNGIRLKLPEKYTKEPNGVELMLVTESGRLRAVPLTLVQLVKLADDATHTLKIVLERGDIFV